MAKIIRKKVKEVKDPKGLSNIQIIYFQDRTEQNNNKKKKSRMLSQTKEIICKIIKT